MSTRLQTNAGLVSEPLLRWARGTHLPLVAASISAAAPPVSRPSAGWETGQTSLRSGRMSSVALAEPPVPEVNPDHFCWPLPSPVPATPAITGTAGKRGRLEEEYREAGL